MGSLADHLRDLPVRFAAPNPIQSLVATAGDGIPPFPSFLLYFYSLFDIFCLLVASHLIFSFSLSFSLVDQFCVVYTDEHIERNEDGSIIDNSTLNSLNLSYFVIMYSF